MRQTMHIHRRILHIVMKCRIQLMTYNWNNAIPGSPRMNVTMYAWEK